MGFLKRSLRETCSFIQAICLRQIREDELEARIIGEIRCFRLYQVDAQYYFIEPGGEKKPRKGCAKASRYTRDQGTFASRLQCYLNDKNKRTKLAPVGRKRQLFPQVFTLA